ncbi:YdeI/OmpD-associated family protein [Paenibacillus lautus]|uniref:YdeI/OmpD-associated family protein n=1 Tax=Paenibacillus lautus TaxID=1401 RepID=UPI00333FDF0E
MIVCPTANQRRLALSIEGAKTMETRQRRIDKTITMLNEGRAQKDDEFLPVSRLIMVGSCSNREVHSMITAVACLISGLFEEKIKEPGSALAIPGSFYGGYFNGTCLDNASNCCRCGAISV